MRNLLSTGFSSEYDVAGVTDPFLQVIFVGLSLCHVCVFFCERDERSY